MVTQSIFLHMLIPSESNSFSHQMHFSECSAIAMAAASILYRSDIPCLQQNISKSDVLVCVSSVAFVHLPSSHTYHISSFWKTYSSLLIIVFMDHFFVIDPTEAAMEESMDTIFYLRGS
jgi:hypothetical protein